MLRFGILALVLLPQVGGATEVRIGAGSESFLWEEYDSSGAKILDESGLRHFISLDSERWLDWNWLSDFSGRIYTGNVEYSGQTQTGIETEPTDTDYDGIRLEAGFSYFPEPGGAKRGNRSGIRMALGVDSWRRGIHDSRTADLVAEPVPGYVENYTTVYGRLGARYIGGERWSLNLGAKYPLRTSETIGLEALGFDNDITLYPRGRLSVSADVEVIFSRTWRAQFYYDSYRYAESDAERVLYNGTPYLVWQPESRQDTFGAKISFTF